MNDPDEHDDDGRTYCLFNSSNGILYFSVPMMNAHAYDGESANESACSNEQRQRVADLRSYGPFLPPFLSSYIFTGQRKHSSDTR